LEVLPVEKWNSIDFIRVCNDALSRNGFERFTPHINHLHDVLKPIITNNKLLGNTFKALSDTAFDIMLDEAQGG
jgi:hypothetical protein